MSTMASTSSPGASPAGLARLAGRRVIITGAASGIGRRTAEVFASEGARLGLLDLDERGALATAARTRGWATRVDITDEPSVERAVAELADALQGIDAVVHAAGIMTVGPVRETSAAHFRRVIDINLTGTYIVTRACLPFLSSASSATVVTIASAQGLLPNVPNHTAYAASKGAVVNLTRAFAAEFAPRVRVNCVCPGMVDTPMADGHRANVGNYALKRIADPEEIAKAILFLTSAESSYVTGAILAVDGGRSFH